MLHNLTKNSQRIDKKYFSKAPFVIVFIQLIFILLLLVSNNSLKKQLDNVQLKEKQEEPKVEEKTKEEKEIDQEIRQLVYFESDVLNQYPDFKAEIGEQKVRRVTPIGGKWIVEVLDNSESEMKNYQPKTQDPRSTAEYRHYYILTDTYWKKLTQDESIPCYIKSAKIIQHDLHIPINTPLTEDMLLMSGSCNLGSFVSLYVNNTGEKIPFKDLNNLIVKENTPSWLIHRIITNKGDSDGLLISGTHGKEPVIVIEYGQHDGIGVFSVRTGNLLQLVLYDNF